MEIPETKKVDVTPDTLISNEPKKEEKKKEVKQPDPVIVSDEQKNVDEVFENAEPLVKQIHASILPQIPLPSRLPLSGVSCAIW